MSDIKVCLEELKQRLEKQMGSETPERTAAREKVLKDLRKYLKEFDLLSQKVGTTPEQMDVISQIGNIVFNLGDIKSKR